MIQRKIHIRQRLRLDALCCVHNQNCAVARCQCTADLIVKVHVSGSVDQVKNIFFPVLCTVNRPHRLGFDRNAALPLQLHVIKHLLLHFSARQKTGLFDNPVCQRRFAVIDMRDDTKISDIALFYFGHSFLTLIPVVNRRILENENRLLRRRHTRHFSI